MSQKNIKENHSSVEPEYEHDYMRSLDLGYNLEDQTNFLSCIEHGAPHPLNRWHFHEEYELHLITETNGIMFVGEFIGNFAPGNLVLTGPYLPHNWVSNDLPKEGVISRDISLQFLDEPLRKASEYLPEIKQVLPLLDRAKSGVQFFGISSYVKKQLLRIKNKKGINSLNEFLILISVLSNHSDYQLLSDNQSENSNLNNHRHKFNEVTDYINKNYSADLVMTEIAEKISMDGYSFSRIFKEAVGCTFTDFVNHTRIKNACILLTETDKYISTISFEVGYNTVANFNRRFIERKKITPSEYRKLSKVNINHS